MARPEKNTVDYFPYFCDEGKKMYYIEQKHGNDGFTVFIKLLRELACAEFHYLNLKDNSQTLLFLAAKCRVSNDKLNEVINDLCLVGKFDAELWAKNSIIWCDDFIESIQDAYKMRKNKCIDKLGLLTHLINLGIIKQDLCIIDLHGNTQRKENKKKRK